MLAEVPRLVTWNVSWPAIIVQARLLTLGRSLDGPHLVPRNAGRNQAGRGLIAVAELQILEHMSPGERGPGG